MPSPSRNKQWRKLLLEFIDNLRIISREETAALGEAGTKIKIWESQQRILDEITSGMDEGIRKFLVLKSRQLGSTTIFVIIDLFWLALHPHTKGALVVDQDKTREEFREQIRFIVSTIPQTYMKFRIAKGGDNKYLMKFTNGSQLSLLVAGTSGAKDKWGESTGFSLVHLTEVASYGSAEGLNNFEEAMSEENPNRLYVYESTAKGPNLWKARWDDGQADPFRTKTIFVGWWSKDSNRIGRGDPLFHVFGTAAPDDKERTRIAAVKQRYGIEITPEQLAWIRWRGSRLSQTENSLNQNQPWLPEEAFVLSGKSFFQTRLIGQDIERVGAHDENGSPLVIYTGHRFWLGQDFWHGSIQKLDPATSQKSEIELRIWHQPVADAQYVIGCDPAGGSSDKNDRHAISIWRCYADRLVQVAEYADNIHDTRQCAWVLAYIAGFYKNCMVNLELNGGYGRAVMGELESLRQQLRADIYRDRRSTTGQDMTEFLDMARWYIYRRPDTPATAGYILNFNTTNSLKVTIMCELRDAHINQILEINSRPMLDEMMLVVQDGMTIEAPNNQHDDRVMAAALAVHAYMQHFQATMIMQGLTYEVCQEREHGLRRAGRMIDRLVADTLRSIEDAPRELTAAQTWMMERFGQ